MVEPLDNSQAYKKTIGEQADKSHSRRDRLVEIEKEAQNLWAEKKLYEADPDSKRKKYFLNFPYPYVNGKLHLGHAYSMSKCEFTIRHKRLKGYNTLWPFSFHCTGMPISAAAEKLKREFNEHGDNIFKWADQLEAEFNAQVEAYRKDPKNGKVSAKLPQVSILRMSRVPDSEMLKFKDSLYWLHYFPPIGKTDLQRLGIMTDWRRSFITTEFNPYYDSFIQWQFHHLKTKGKISFGQRPTIYSTIDKQACADHDRAEGEGAVPQEFTLIKLRCLELPGRLETLKDKKVFLVAATLRPETMYGQTNCFVLPTGKYGCYEMKNDEVWIVAEKSARNMAYQGLTKIPEKWNSLLDVSGEELVGIPLKAPLSPYEKVYALPMMTISMNKCTGVVTSVPSDSPDDYATLRDLKNKAPLREKYKLKDEHVLPFEPIPIIEIPGYGNLIAERACDEFKVNSQNDKEQLEKAKDLAYTKGFYEGRFIVEEFKDMKVLEAKTLIRDKMINNDEAHIYYESDKQVVSRSGDVCVVTYTDQWLINYGEEEWKKKIQEHVNSKNFNPYLESNLNAFNDAIDWLKEWGVSRSFGLGSRLGWDKQLVIESLSDSTIYMAYYTVAHLLQGDLEGSQPGALNITPEQLTIDVWNYIFLKTEYKEEYPVPKAKLDALREQFRYFYPWDLRCSAKDLIRNHLTMSLYNHATIWEDEPEMWPRGIWCNGYLLIDGEKMSKSLGNFLTIEDCIEKYGADATRMAVADAGDTLDDANFIPSLADNAVLKIWQLERWIQEALKGFETMREPDHESPANTKFYDSVFLSQLELTLSNVDKAYETMRIRDVLKYGFFDLLALKEDYKINCGEQNMKKDIFLRYLETQLVVMYPVIPHFCEIVWKKYYVVHLPKGHNKPELLSNHLWPQVDTEKIDFVAIRAYQYIKELFRTLRVAYDKFNSRRKDPTAPTATIHIIYSPEYYDWQKNVLQILSGCNVTEKNEIFDDWKTKINEDKNISDDIRRKSLQFGAYLMNQLKTGGKEILTINLSYNEKDLILRNFELLKKEFKASEVKLIETEAAKASQNKLISQAANSVLPGRPQGIFE